MDNENMNQELENMSVDATNDSIQESSESNDNITEPDTELAYDDYDTEWHKTISFKDFYKDYCDPTTKKNIKQACVVLYVCSGITLAMYLLVVSALMSGSLTENIPDLASVIISIASVITLVILTIFVHAKQSRICASIIMLYAMGTFFYSLATTGKPGGLLVLIGAIYAFRYTFSAHKEHKNFKN